jgi:hypothetical protein
VGEPHLRLPESATFERGANFYSIAIEMVQTEKAERWCPPNCGLSRRLERVDRGKRQTEGISDQEPTRSVGMSLARRFNAGIRGLADPVA